MLYKCFGSDKKNLHVLFPFSPYQSHDYRGCEKRKKDGFLPGYILA